MNIVPFVMQIIALVFFAMAWFNIPFPRASPWNLIAAGLFLALLSFMIAGHIDLHPVSVH